MVRDISCKTPDTNDNLNDKSKDDKEQKVISAIELTIICILLLFFGLMSVLIGTLTSIISLVLVIAWLVYYFIYKKATLKNGKRKVLFVIFVLLACFYLNSFPPVFVFSAKWNYVLQKTYITKLHYINDEDFLPKSLFQVESEDCKIGFTPPMLQGSGFYNVSFYTTDEQIEKYIKQYSESAIMTFPLIDYYDVRGLSEKYKDEIAAIVKEKAKTDDQYKYTDFNILKFYFSPRMKGNVKGSVVYVIDSNFDWNHPHNKIVIINKDSRLIEFSIQ